MAQGVYFSDAKDLRENLPGQNGDAKCRWGRPKSVTFDKKTGCISTRSSAKLESFVSRCKRLAYCSSEVPTYSDLTDEADDTLFSRIMVNHGHVLQPLLPDRHSIPYSLRERSHNKTLLNKSTHLNNDDFLIRMLYKDSY